MQRLIATVIMISMSLFAAMILSCDPHLSHSMDKGQPIPVTEGSFSIPLTFPDEVGSNTSLVAQTVITNTTGLGSVSGLGYSSNSLLGPTIKVKRGETVNIGLSNQLNEVTNIHWHGLKVPPNMDGQPESVIGSGSSFLYTFAVNQRASFYWYHPHPHMLTGKQVFKGLAGLFIVNDDEEAALNLPSGIREVPLVIQDKRVSNGSIPYNPTMGEMMTGVMGQYILVNGVYAPFHNVMTAKYRVRILNGSNARIYNLALSDNSSVTLIGNDGGLLPAPVSVSSLLLAPGERADLIIDFSKKAIGAELFLVSKTFNGGHAQGVQEFKIMKFKVTEQVEDTFEVPAMLSSVERLAEGMATETRYFDIQNVEHTMSGGMMLHTINNKVYDDKRIDEFVKEGSIEVWTFDNTKGDEPHPMHLHGVQFQILSRTGGRGTLTPLEDGWKDMVLCMPGEKVKIIIPFYAFTGKFLYHCHNLEHEDTGMMGQFKVE